MDSENIITILGLGSAAVAIVSLGVIVLVQNSKKNLHRIFFALTLACASWTLTNLAFAITSQPMVQYLFALLSYGAAGMLALFFLQYCLELTRIGVRRLYSTLFYIVGITASLLSVMPGFIAIEVNSDDQIITNPLPLALFGFYLVIYMGTGLTFLLRALAKFRGVERSKILIMLAGLIMATVAGVFFNLILPLMGNYGFVKIGPVATLLFVAMCTYAIVKHGLFDIKLAAVRSVAYALSLGTIALIYYFAAYFISILVFQGEVTSSVSLSPFNVLIALGLAFVFQYVKNFFDRVTDNFFYKSNYKSEDFFASLSKLLSSTINLHGLLGKASQEIANTFRVEQAFFFLYYTNDVIEKDGRQHHMSAGTEGHKTMPVRDARLLDEFIRTQKDATFLTDFLPEEYNSVRRMLVSHHVALVMPLRHDDKIVGYLMLGDKLSGSFAKRDLNVLQAVSDELIIAIQNALTLHQVKELNATLQQRINVATKELRSSNNQLKHLDSIKDEFISMASHQLRTPLTSVKGYISMVLEGDGGEVTPKQEKLLKEAFNSSERMVRLIADFLNVSRLQTGKFLVEKTKVDMNKLVRQEVKSLALISEMRKIKLREKITKEPIIVDADEAKVRQIVMNYIDNAIYYSRPNSTVVINLEKMHKKFAFTVVDTGIGVPEADQPKLFNKFFRAPNAKKARPDGTGVGLYMARRVIEGHKGKIIFSSREGRGSTFGFSMPIEEDKSS